MQIYWNKRKHLLKKRVHLPEDWFGTKTWPPFHCFGTRIWLPWCHVKTLYSSTAQLTNRSFYHFRYFWNFDLLSASTADIRQLSGPETLSGLSTNGPVMVLFSLCFFTCRWWYGLALGSQPLWSVGIRECWHFIKAKSFVFVSRAKVINSVDTIFRLSGVKIHTTTAENPRLF